MRSGNVKSLDQQISEVKREVEMRHRVYANMVRRGSLDQPTADHQYECMQAVLETLIRLSKAQGEVEVQ
jgi:hypothetical protein